MKELIEIVSIIEMVFAGLAVAGFLIALVIVEFTFHELEANGEVSDEAKSTISALLIFLFVLIGILVAVNAFFAYYLHRAVKNRDLTQANTWFRVQCALLVCSLILTVGRNLVSDPAVIIKSIVPTAYRCWSLYVVRNFVKKLREEGPEEMEAPSSFQPMTQA